jgi:hypothetical protein
LKKEKLRAKDRLVLLSNVPMDSSSAPPGDPLPA